MKYTRKEVTIKDVAQHAGVAVSTVSRVLNNLDRVSDETRDKVKKACEELGFVRNAMAASVKTGRTKMIVVVVPDIVNEYYTAVIQGVESVAIQKGYFTLVFATNDSVRKESELFTGQFGRIVDGVIMIPAHDDLSFVKKFDKPVVIIDRYVYGCGLEAVIVDNYQGTYMLTNELIRNGHRDIAILIGPRTFNIGQERLNGYLDAMSEAGIPVKKENIINCTWYAESGHAETAKVLQRSQLPTAIVATNNLLCVGCMEAIMERKMKIGKDISLVSFDDTLLAQYTSPGVTVVTRETIEMGRIGAEKLIELMEGKQTSSTPRKVILPVTLIKRNSVRNLNKNK